MCIYIYIYIYIYTRIRIIIYIYITVAGGGGGALREPEALAADARARAPEGPPLAGLGLEAQLPAGLREVGVAGAVHEDGDVAEDGEVGVQVVPHPSLVDVAEEALARARGAVLRHD